MAGRIKNFLYDHAEEIGVMALSGVVCATIAYTNYVIGYQQGVIKTIAAVLEGCAASK